MNIMFYDIQIYLPNNFYDINHVMFIKQLCSSYDVSHTTKFRSSGAVLFYLTNDNPLKYGVVYGATVRNVHVLDFLKQLPKKSLISEIIYIQNINIEPLLSLSNTTFNGSSQSTSEIKRNFEDTSGSEGGSNSLCRRDSDNSLKKLSHNYTNSIVYTNPYFQNIVNLSDMKTHLTPIEKNIIKICKSFENNILMRQNFE